MATNKCRMCRRKGVIIQGDVLVCDRHYRFRQMRASARFNGKSVPSMEELRSLLPGNMRCPLCNTKMIWRAIYGEKRRVITLQHDESGRHRLICLSCNSAHGSGPKDLIYKIKADEKHCRKCGKIKKKTKFGKNKRSINGRTASCRECINKYDRFRYRIRQLKH